MLVEGFGGYRRSDRMAAATNVRRDLAPVDRTAMPVMVCRYCDAGCVQVPGRPSDRNHAGGQRLERQRQGDQQEQGPTHAGSLAFLL